MLISLVKAISKEFAGCHAERIHYLHQVLHFHIDAALIPAVLGPGDAGFQREVLIGSKTFFFSQMPNPGPQPLVKLFRFYRFFPAFHTLKKGKRHFRINHLGVCHSRVSFLLELLYLYMDKHFCASAQKSLMIMGIRNTPKAHCRRRSGDQASKVTAGFFFFR